MRRPGLTDDELVKRATGGDVQAFDRLVMRHRSRLYDIARHITGEADAAQDVVQEAFVNAFRSLGALRDGARLGQWLNTIVRRESARWLREGRRRPQPASDPALHGSPDGMWRRPPAVSSEVVGHIRDALRFLSQRERRIMILHYLEGYTCEEIGSSMGLSAGGVRRVLYTSRRKVRKESTMTSEAEKARKGPRKLKVWISGGMAPGRRNVFDSLRTLLAQAICLAANKDPRTPEEIADVTGAHVDYVDDVASDLIEMGALASSKRRLGATFIAFNGEDWRRVNQLVPEPAGEVAQRFAEAEGPLRAAFEETPLAASGWEWEDVVWVVYAVQLANTAIGRREQRDTPTPPPDRPDGGRYWLAAREDVPDLRSPWTTGLNAWSSSQNLECGCFWTWQIEREHVLTVSSSADRSALLEGLADGPRSEDHLLAAFPGDAERGRAALADLIKLGFVSKTNGEYRLSLPLFAQAESDILAPVLDAIAAGVYDDILRPAVSGVDSLLDDLGYGRLRDQYPAWRIWIAHQMTGEAVSFLVEQEVLPSPGDPAPPEFGHLLWRPGIELMSFGRER